MYLPIKIFWLDETKTHVSNADKCIVMSPRDGLQSNFVLRNIFAYMHK